MYLTLESDYAVRIVIFLAKKEGRVDAKTISEQTSVTFRFTLKILRKLVDGGLVRSYQGAKGGYQLARSPELVTLYDVISLTEDLAVSRCLLGDYPCSHENHAPCKLQKTFSKISEKLNAELAAVTIAQLM